MLIRLYEKHNKVPVLIKEMTLKDWSQHGLSARNKHFYQLRKTEGHDENIYMRLLYKNGNILTRWIIYPTYAAGKEPVKNFNTHGEEYSSRFYALEIMFANISGELEDWWDLDHKAKVARVRGWFDTWDDTKFYSSDPSFLGQGAWYRVDQLDSAIYPFPSQYTDKNIWGAKHDNYGIYLTKHFAAVLPLFKANADDLVESLDTVLKGEKSKMKKVTGHKKPVEKEEPEEKSIEKKPEPVKKKLIPKEEPEEKPVEKKKPEPVEKEKPVKEPKKKRKPIPKEEPEEEVPESVKKTVDNLDKALATMKRMGATPAGEKEEPKKPEKKKRKPIPKDEPEEKK